MKNLCLFLIILFSVLITEFNVGLCASWCLEPMETCPFETGSNALLKHVLRRSFDYKMQSFYSFMDEKISTIDETSPLSVVAAVNDAYDYITSIWGDVEFRENMTYIVAMRLREMGSKLVNVYGPISALSKYECTPSHVVLYCMFNVDADVKILEALKAFRVDLEAIKKIDIKSAIRCLDLLRIFSLAGASFFRPDSIGISLADLMKNNCKYKRQNILCS